MSGNVTTAGDMNVMPGGALRVAKTTIGGNLENGGTVQMNSEGGKPGNVLTVNGNHLDGCERFRPYPERRNAH